jgi:hypothetical protein
MAFGVGHSRFACGDLQATGIPPPAVSKVGVASSRFLLKCPPNTEESNGVCVLT